MADSDLEKLFGAAKSGDGKTASEISGRLKDSLSPEKREMLERALTDRGFLKELLSSEKAKQIIEGLNGRENGNGY